MNPRRAGQQLDRILKQLVIGLRQLAVSIGAADPRHRRTARDIAKSNDRKHENEEAPDARDDVECDHGRHTLQVWRRTTSLNVWLTPTRSPEPRAPH